MNTKKKDISCPTCSKKETWTEENTYRPFCSARCKLIDLGEWAAEQHRIPGDPIQTNDGSNSDESSEEK